MNEKWLRSLVRRFKESRECWCFLSHFIANLLRVLLELGFFALFVGEYDADGPNGFAGLVLQYQFDFEMVSLFVHFQVRLACFDYTQIALVPFFPHPSDLRTDDDVFSLSPLTSL